MHTSFKTPKGTELPFFMIERSKKDKRTGQYVQMPAQPYLQVAHRLVWFREEHPDWCIDTSVHTLTDQYAIFRADIRTEKGTLVGSAHKREDAAHFSDFIEKAETSAIGRALALCGYGTQFAPELDEEDRLADAPIDRPKTAFNSYTPSPLPAVQPTEAERVAAEAMEMENAGSGAFCMVCATELIVSKSGKGYFCPNYKAPGGEHSRFPIGKLNEFKEMQKEANR